MLCSMLGDGLLVYNEAFIFGMLAFAAGQICFIKAFTMQPLKLWIGISMYILMVLLLG